MALTSGLTLYCYTAPTSSTPPKPVAYRDEVEQLTFTTQAPGGFGTLTAHIKLKDARLPHPEFALFSRVALMGPARSGVVPPCLFLGEITEPALTVDATGGEYMRITALGIGNALRDDPLSIAYSLQTPKQVVTDQITAHGRSAYLPIDQDMSAVFPDNPAATYSPSYDNRNIEDTLNDITLLAGDYTWGIWAHPRNTDSAGFPTGQLQVHLRDTSTTSWQASFLARDIRDASVTPAADRAYNVIDVGWNNKQSGFQLATQPDGRLNGDGSQGSAPFRRRKIRKDLSNLTTVRSADATAIATMYLSLYKNVSNKVKLTLDAVRDGNNNPAPLWAVTADSNISVPELAVRGTQLATAPTAAVNQFYILSTTYTESATGATLALECDNWQDNAKRTIDRLQLIADLRSRAGKTNGNIQMIGATETGYCGIEFTGAVNGGHSSFNSSVNFQQIMAQTPTSVSVSADGGASNYNTTTPTTTGISCVGFRLVASCNFSAGDTWGRWYGWYTTAGNCLRGVLHEEGRLHWHCDGCDTLHTGLAIAEHAQVLYPCPDCHEWHGQAGAHPLLQQAREACRHAGRPEQALRAEPGGTALALVCPSCGTSESFNTGLSAADADVDAPNNYAHRAEQAALIRQLMAHPLVGLRLR